MIKLSQSQINCIKSYAERIKLNSPHKGNTECLKTSLSVLYPEIELDTNGDDEKSIKQKIDEILKPNE
jgi:hypothetical protein